VKVHTEQLVRYEYITSKLFANLMRTSGHRQLLCCLWIMWESTHLGRLKGFVSVYQLWSGCLLLCFPVFFFWSTMKDILFISSYLYLVWTGASWTLDFGLYAPWKFDKLLLLFIIADSLIQFINQPYKCHGLLI
jgi:hypothetical protein